jgi:SRSO17 transposase
LLTSRPTGADALRDVVRDYVIQHLADANAVLVTDETGFLKQGEASCELARQYTGSAGKITNYQIGVFACYATVTLKHRTLRPVEQIFIDCIRDVARLLKESQ